MRAPSRASLSPACCQPPLFRIENFDYGSVIKSRDFHCAPVQNLMATLPYPHRHDFFHIVWIARGSGRHIIDSVTYDVRPGALFFMAPGQIHDCDLSPDTEGYTFNFSAEFFALHLQDKGMLSRIPVYDHAKRIQALYTEGPDLQDIQATLDAIQAEYEGERFRAHDLIRSYLFILLVKASRLAEPADAADTAHRSLLLYRQFQGLLDQHFASVQQPGHYARLLHTTERALNEAVRRWSGATTAQAIRERVILEAKRLLAHSGVQVAQVGDQLGFDDPAYFSRCFKKHTGRTPVEFRQSIGRITS